MIVFLYILAFFISFHHGIRIHGLKKFGILGKNIHSAIISVGMIAVNIAAMVMESWDMLVLGFAVYSTYEFFEMVWAGMKKKKPVTLLIPTNLLMIISSIVSYSTEIWWLFIISYCLFWTLTLFIGRKSVNRQIQSQKV